MIKTSIILFVLFYLVTAHSQQTIDKLNSNQLKLPKETISKALSIDATGQVKSSATSSTELGYLSGVTSNVQDQINDKANDADAVHLTGDESVAGVKTLTGKLVTSSTVNASIPCPVMTGTQRDAIVSPSVGDCVFNSDTLLSNIYDGVSWNAMGGGSGSGISLWLPSTYYAVDAVVIDSGRIYRAISAHTSSSSFATDLLIPYWQELLQGIVAPVSMADGGTGQILNPNNGGVVYSDSDSLELIGPGGPGQFLQSNGFAAPSWGDETQYNVTNFLKTLTPTGTLLETGNKNILTNPSFEHSTFDSGGWVNSAGSFTEDFTFKLDGAKSARLVLSSQTMSLTQSSVLYQSNFVDGVQGIATVRIKSSVALKVCSIQAGTVSTSNCVNVPSDNKWGLFKVPFILGATSNGISIASTGAVSGTVYIDDAFVGAVDLKQDVNNIGPWTTGVCTSTWTVNATTACKYRQVGDTAEVQYRVTLTGAPNAATLTFSTPNGLTIDTSKEFSRMGSTGSFITDISGPIYYPSFPYAASPTAIGVGYGTSSTGLNPSATVFNSVNNTAPMTFATGDEVVVTIKIPVTQFSNATSVYTSNNANYSPRAFTPTVAYNTGGATNVTWTGFESRNGNRLIVDIKGTFSAASAAFTVPRFTLPNGLLVDAAKLPTGVNNFKTVGYGSAEDQAIVNTAVIPTYAGNPSFIQIESITNSLPFVFNTNDTITLHYEVPILGWENSNIIIGQFNGLQSCTDTLACTDTFSAKISATGIVSAENIDWINGNCTMANPTNTCTFKAGVFTVSPNCVVVFDDNSLGSLMAKINNLVTSSTQVGYITQIAGANTYQAEEVNIICQKQGADYIGKTAMAVASDQNIRTPGATNAVVYSFRFGSTGSVSIDNGDLVNGSCTNANPTVCTWNSGKITNSICTLTADNVDRSFRALSVGATNGTFTMFKSSDGTTPTLDTGAFVICHGVSE